MSCTWAVQERDGQTRVSTTKGPEGYSGTGASEAYTRRGSKSWHRLAWQREDSGSYQCVSIPHGAGGCPFSVVPSWQDKRQGGKTEIQELLFHRRVFCKGKTEQVSQRGWGVTILGDIQNLTGYGPEQSILANPTLSRRLD